jgi:hypothetical protein
VSNTQTPLSTKPVGAGPLVFFLLLLLTAVAGGLAYWLFIPRGDGAAGRPPIKAPAAEPVAPAS